MSHGPRKAPTQADFEEFRLVVGMIEQATRAAVQAAPHAEDPLATLRAGQQTLESLYVRFETVAERLLGERRAAPETPDGFFARIATMDEERLVALMISNGLIF